MNVGTVVALARAELRRGWRSLLLITVLAAVVGTTTVGAVSVARRTMTAYDRLAAQTGLDDARGLVHVHDDLVPQIVGLPQVDEHWTGRLGIAQLGDSFTYLGITAGPEEPSPLLRPVVLEGRLPRPTGGDVVEVALRDDFQREVGVPLGTEATATFLTQADYFRFDTGFEGGSPNGPELTVRVVGTVRLGGGYSTLPPAFTAPEVLGEHPDAFEIGASFFVRLKDGARSFPGFQEAAADLAAGRQLPPEAEEFVVVEVTDTAEADASVEHTASLLGQGLLALALAVGGIGTVAILQAFGRHHAVAFAARATQAALGVTRSQRRGAQALAASAPAVMAGAATCLGAWLLRGVEPIGAVRNSEPSPGPVLNVAVVLGGVALVVLVVVAASLVTAALASQRRAASPARESRLVLHAARIGSSPAGVSGLRFALEPGRGARAVPVRSAISGAVLGIAGVVAGTVFAGSLDRLVDSPSRSGIPFDVQVSDTPPAAVDMILELPEAATVVVVDSAPIELDGRGLAGHALEPRRGDIEIDLATGRLPRTPDEVVLGLRIASELGKGVGETVTARSAGGSTRPLAIVGTAVVPPFNGEQFGLNALLTPTGLRESAEAAPFTGVATSTRPGTDPDELAGVLSESLEASRPVVPTEVGNLSELGRLPHLVAGLVGLVALISLVHALVLLVRRRAADLAILRTIGFTRRQAAGSVLVMSTAIAAIGIVVGVPVGLAVGSSLWELTAAGAFVSEDALVRWSILAAVAALAAAVAMVAGVLPGRRAGRTSPARLLRAE